MTQRFIPFEKSEEDASPVYYRLAKAIQERIESGVLTVGERIPSEREFATLYDVSLATVRKALESLVHRGFLCRIQGKGTFVSDTDSRRHKLRYYPFVRDFHQDAAIIEVQCIGLEIVKGQERINRYLQLETDDELYEMKRVLLCRKIPMVYSVSYLPHHMFKSLSDYDLQRFEKYLYLFLEDEFGVSTIENEELYGAAVADEETARYLKVETGHPLLWVEMIAFTFKKKPYEYRTSYCRTDEMKIRRII